MDPKQLAFNIQDANGELAYNNSLIGDTKVNYFQWGLGSAEAGITQKDPDGNNELVMVDGVYADLSVSRMMADHKNEFYLTVTNLKNNEDIITQVPVIQYALLSREYYEMAYNHSMTDQEFLDREDEYVLTFFLDQNINWVNTAIYIHSWRVVLNEKNLQ